MQKHSKPLEWNSRLFSCLTFFPSTPPPKSNLDYYWRLKNNESSLGDLQTYCILNLAQNHATCAAPIGKSLRGSPIDMPCVCKHLLESDFLGLVRSDFFTNRATFPLLHLLKSTQVKRTHKQFRYNNTSSNSLFPLQKHSTFTLRSKFHAP